jgi:glycosyltransferase involved in cell wall biosynthesis
MSQSLFTILLPHYKTLELTTLCLQLLRKYTDLNLANIIVIDNDSQDASLDYLRKLSWIKLIERKAVFQELPVQAHARALDLALEHARTPYVLSMHTDSLVKHPKWLIFLLEQIEKDSTIAGIGSWKLEVKPWWRRTLKKVERQLQAFYYSLLSNTQHNLSGIGKNYYYLRSHCAMYRLDLLRKFNLHFADGDMVAGKSMHKQLINAGYQMIFLASDVLSKYLEHINHATTILNPHLSRQKSVDKRLRHVKKSLMRLQAKVVL